MRNRTPSAGRQHQLVLSLSPHCLHIVYFQRGLMGWKRANEARLTLLEGDDFLPQFQNKLFQCITQWKLPPAVRVHWIIAGDILGIIPPTPNEANASAALPFNANDTRIQPDQYKNSEQPSLMWMHKDWVAEIERISGHCQLTLVEIFARAQLFQRRVAQLAGALKIVIEQEDDQYFLHIFAATGMMLRTSVLSDKEATEPHSLLRAELASLNFSAADGQNREVHLLAPKRLIASASTWHGFNCQPLEKIADADLVEQLWRSDLEGIVIRPTYEDVVTNIKRMSIAMGVAGLTGLGLMSWHDGKLQQQIEEGRVQARKDLPAVEAAKALKLRTLEMADAVNAAKKFRENTGAMTAFNQILANFPPAPATLLYVRTDEKSLAFAGSGDETSVKWIQEKTFPGYEPLAELAVPDFLQSSNPSIHFQSRKSNSDAAVSTAAAPPTSTAASRTVAP